MIGDDMGKGKGVLMLIIFLVAITLVSSLPEIASEFYGTATINGSNAHVGANVTAYDPDGVLCGFFIVSNQGYYGSLSCNGDDSETTIDEGAEPNDNITFYVENQRALIFGNRSWEAGAFKEVNISVQDYAPTFDHDLVHQHVNESSRLLYDINCFTFCIYSG